MGLFAIINPGSSLLRWHNKAPNPPEIYLCTQQHLSWWVQTWFNILVTYPTLCPSLQLKKSKVLPTVPSCGWLGAPQGMVTCSHPGSLHHHAYTVFTSLLCQPWCQLWVCQQTSFLLPVQHHETRKLVPVCWTGVGLRSIFDIQRPAVLHSTPEILSRWIKRMKCKCCFIGFFYVVTSGCTGVLGVVGMLNVCTRYVVKRCGDILSQQHVRRGRNAPRSYCLFRKNIDLGFQEASGWKYWPHASAKITWMNLFCTFTYLLYVPKEYSISLFLNYCWFCLEHLYPPVPEMPAASLCSFAVWRDLAHTFAGFSIIFD